MNIGKDAEVTNRSWTTLRLVAVALAIGLSGGCERPSDDRWGRSGPDDPALAVQLPAPLATSRIRPEALTLRLTVNGTEIPMGLDGGRWAGSWTVEEGQPMNLDVSFSSAGLDLARHSRSLGSITRNRRITVGPDDYDLFDDDGDGYSNIRELDDGSDPNDSFSIPPGPETPDRPDGTGGERVRYVDDRQKVVNEADGSVTLSIERIGSLDREFSLTYEPKSGSALNGEDFLAEPGTLTWGIGEGGRRFVEIQLIQDDIFEEQEFFEVAFFNATEPDEFVPFDDTGGSVGQVYINDAGGSFDSLDTSRIEGEYDASTFSDDGAFDEVYVVIHSFGRYSVHDWRGDTVDADPDCYISQNLAVTSLGDDLYDFEFSFVLEGVFEVRRRDEALVFALDDGDEVVWPRLGSSEFVFEDGDPGTVDDFYTSLSCS